MPNPTTTFPPSLGITPSCRPTFKKECHIPHFVGLLRWYESVPCCFFSTEQPLYRPGDQQGPLLHHQIQPHRLLGEDTPEAGVQNYSKRNDIPCWRAKLHLQLLSPCSHPLQPQCLAEWRRSDMTSEWPFKSLSNLIYAWRGKKVPDEGGWLQTQVDPPFLHLALSPRPFLPPLGLELP